MKKVFNIQQTSAKDDPNEIKQYSTDKPKKSTILNDADEGIATICTDEENSKKIEINISEHCERNEPAINSLFTVQPCKESAYFVLEKI